MIKLIIFDYDGVIVDSFVNTYNAYKVIAQKLKKQFPPDIEGFRKIYGYSYLECYRNLEIHPEEHTQAEAIYKEEMRKVNPVVYAGVKDVLAKLKETYTLTLLSANYEEEILNQLQLFGLRTYFDKVIGKVHPSEPPVRKSEKFIQLMRDYEVTPEETIMIGDREIDYNHAQEAGMPHKIIVEYGWGYDKTKLKGFNQKIIVHKPIDILDAIEAIEKEKS